MNNVYQKYELSYYTGTQASILVGGIWIDEAYGVQFQATQNMVPLYSFASSRFDAMAKGKVLVQGYFEINFVDNGYLYAALMEATKRAAEDVDSTGSVPANLSMGELSDEFNDTAKMVDATTGGSSMSAVRLFNEIYAPNKTRLNDVAQQMTVLKNLKQLEGRPEDKNVSVVYPNWNRTMNSLMDNLSTLDMTSIGYVASMIDRQYAEAEDDCNVIYDAIPFTLTGSFGRQVGSPDGAYKEIKNCFLISNEVLISCDDQPVRERYAFIAQYHI
jgi:hypothetical protein